MEIFMLKKNSMTRIAGIYLNEKLDNSVRYNQLLSNTVTGIPWTVNKYLLSKRKNKYLIL